MKKQLWIVCEINYGMLTIESWQMLTVARNLAKKMPLEISVIIPNEVKNQDVLINEKLHGMRQCIIRKNR